MSDRFAVGDIIRLKKKHPCGNSHWEILRVGADFRLKCMGCQHQVMVPRKLVEKNLRELIKAERNAGPDEEDKDVH
ncbi:MAG: DUF951 domain-containing protein [Lachnospiraceae bacterium]|nr:DUF951 domain-containing protein [Lachnospiraceae bacterium]